MRGLPLLLVVTLLAAELHAATTYRVRTHREGWPRPSTSTTNVTIDGANVRADYETGAERAALHGTLISRDGGNTYIALNHELRTWYPLEGAGAFVPRPSTLLNIPGQPAKKIKWSQTATEGRLSYVLEHRFEGTSVRLKCSAVVTVRPAAGVARELWPGRVVLSTGIEEVDAQLAKSAELLTSFPEEIVVVATKQYDGGPPSTETITLTVDEIRTVDKVQPALFERPSAYIQQAPIIGVPGR